MPKTITVKLTQPFSGHEGQITEIILREPRASEYFDFGECEVWGRVENGEVRKTTVGPVIKQYLAKCITSPDPLLALSQMGLADGLAVKEALLSFFNQALAVASPPGATSSSSTSSSSVQESAAS